MKADIPWLGRMPSADDKERSGERSNVIKGLAVEQALALSSSKEGEGRRIPDTVVTIHNGKKGVTRSPRQSVAHTLHVSTPTTPSVSPMCAVAQNPQPSDDPMPPIEVTSRRHDLNVVSKTSEVYPSCSRSLETAHKQSSHPVIPFSFLKGEGQLTRAAAYIQERIKHRSSMVDEFVCRTPKVPPDKKTEPDTQRHILNIVSEIEKASVSICSPEFSMESVLLFRSQSKAVPPMQPNKEAQAVLSRRETPGANERFTESLESTTVSAGPKRNDDGVRGRNSAPSIEDIGTDRRSSERLIKFEEAS